MSNRQETNRQKLLALSKGQVSTWSKDAEYRSKNKKWLRYSSNIARRILAAMEDQNGKSQKSLAEEIGVSPQYISKVVKGKENLTLETIAKLSEALGKELITFPEYKHSKSLTDITFKSTEVIMINTYVGGREHVGKAADTLWTDINFPAGAPKPLNRGSFENYRAISLEGGVLI